MITSKLWCILQQNKPDDFVIATGQQISVRQFVELCAPNWDKRYLLVRKVLTKLMRNDTGQIVVRQILFIFVCRS